jgi:Mor family transcriptional regulator
MVKMVFVNDEEIRKDVVGYEGHYQVSSLGNVRSIKIRYIKPSVDKDGYLKVSLSKENVAKQYFVHRLVGKSFLNNISNLPQINHKDGIKTNNKASNLEWSTALENLSHAYANGLKFLNFGEENRFAKFTSEDILSMRKDRELGMSYRELSIKYNCEISNVRLIIRRKTWKHI